MKSPGGLARQSCNILPTVQERERSVEGDRWLTVTARWRNSQEGRDRLGQPCIPSRIDPPACSQANTGIGIIRSDSFAVPTRMTKHPRPVRHCRTGLCGAFTTPTYRVSPIDCLVMQLANSQCLGGTAQSTMAQLTALR